MLHVSEIGYARLAHPRRCCRSGRRSRSRSSRSRRAKTRSGPHLAVAAVAGARSLAGRGRPVPRGDRADRPGDAPGDVRRLRRDRAGHRGAGPHQRDRRRPPAEPRPRGGPARSGRTGARARGRLRQAPDLALHGLGLRRRRRIARRFLPLREPRRGGGGGGGGRGPRVREERYEEAEVGPTAVRRVAAAAPAARASDRWPTSSRTSSRSSPSPPRPLSHPSPQPGEGKKALLLRGAFSLDRARGRLHLHDPHHPADGERLPRTWTGVSRSSRNTTPRSIDTTTVSCEMTPAWRLVTQR